MVILTICLNAYISRCGDFRADDNNNRQTNPLLYPLHACARGNYAITYNALQVTSHNMDMHSAMLNPWNVGEIKHTHKQRISGSFLSHSLTESGYEAIYFTIHADNNLTPNRTGSQENQVLP